MCTNNHENAAEVIDNTFTVAIKARQHLSRSVMALAELLRSTHWAILTQYKINVSSGSQSQLPNGHLVLGMPCNLCHLGLA